MKEKVNLLVISVLLQAPKTHVSTSLKKVVSAQRHVAFVTLHDVLSSLSTKQSCCHVLVFSSISRQEEGRDFGG
jgi:hypothetical protein